MDKNGADTTEAIEQVFEYASMPLVIRRRLGRALCRSLESSFYPGNAGYIGPIDTLDLCKSWVSFPQSSHINRRVSYSWPKKPMTSDSKAHPRLELGLPDSESGVITATLMRQVMAGSWFYPAMCMLATYQLPPALDCQ
jgi:hypothetical protein